ncbi:hypothetical protein CFOL_v3_10585 [Cephalotus follicularis]|uniref:Exo_endo_phos domain-containing protein n=1 Tax=Cephalotus follicularis TaxID=3775 RepID=A0A1Q3BGC7_CEPFO|nr:hypothetical protein CFOL_v3_10585 [Cephalotus follicularis]
MPWCVLGDFNVTRFSYEHNTNSNITKVMGDFNRDVRTAELEDLRTYGLNFTWNNMRIGVAVISKKLDRAMGNWEWLNFFGESYVHVHSPGISDHSPLSIQLIHQLHHLGRPFKFLNLWADHVDFLATVRHEWAKEYYGSPLKIIQLKLKSLKGPLKNLLTKPDSRAATLKLELQKIQTSLDTKPEDV